MKCKLFDRCIGEESNIKKKLCSEQTRRCNEKGCPVIKMKIMAMMKIMKMIMKMIMKIMKMIWAMRTMRNR